MNKWDKVEKKNKYSESDIRWEYFKMTMVIITGIVYLYFVFS